MLTSVDEAKHSTYEGIEFIGTVVDNDDPLQIERIRVSIPNLYSGPVTSLPWVGKISSSHCGAGYGRFGPPPVGALVKVHLQHGDPHYPVYDGSFYTAATSIPEAKANYPHREGFKDEKGNVFWIDRQTGDLELKHFSGKSMHINPDGSIVIDVVSTTLTSNSGVTIFASAGTTVVGNVIVDGDVIASGISLVHHNHVGVKSGSDVSGPPQG